MVAGLFALMLGVNPKQVHAWYMAVYVDAVEWVELPNTLGMSPHCNGCRYDPALRSGEAR
jgi:deoxyribodipyrimidine photolyase-related protein